MQIKSSAFGHEQNIPSKYTCDGENICPPLEFSDIPDEADSLALIVDDPDAPTGKFMHWLVWRLPPETLEIKEGEIPSGRQAPNDFGKQQYGGPCPPGGKHRYFFKLYALPSDMPDLPESASARELEKIIEDNAIEKAELIGFFERS